MSDKKDKARMMGSFVRAVPMLLVLVAAACWAVPSSAARCYVNKAANGSNTGQNWSNAYSDLQSALNAPTCQEIWVAKGAYYTAPKPANLPMNYQKETFQVGGGIKLYGGFAGNETVLSQRNIELNLTALSGDVERNDCGDDFCSFTQTDGITETVARQYGFNAYHVVTIGGMPTNGHSNIGKDTILDGFTISGGDATHNYPIQLAGDGGGIDCRGRGTGNSCGPQLRNLVLIGNWALDGGALSINASNGGGSSPTVSNVLFINNGSVSSGGAVFVNAEDSGRASPMFQNVQFKYNDAYHQSGEAGGGIAGNIVGDGKIDLAVSDAEFTGNLASNGGALSIWKYASTSPGNATINLNRVTFKDNYATLYGGAIALKDYGYANITLNMTNVTLASNEAEYGGALYTRANIGSQVDTRMTNVTFSDNLASLYGGTIYNSLESSQTIPQVALTMALKNVIIWGSESREYTGDCAYTDVYNDYYYGYAAALPDIQINHSVVEHGDTAICNEPFGVASTAVSVGAGNRADDPQLLPLADNGGATLTMLPKPSGSAVDNGTSNGAPSTDQRHVSRPQNGRVDIGAAEWVFSQDVIFAGDFE